MKTYLKSKIKFFLVCISFIGLTSIFLKENLYGETMSSDLDLSVPKVEAISVPGEAPSSGDFSFPVSSGPKTVYLTAKAKDEIQMMRGDLETLKVRSLTRISISNPDIADISSVDSEQVVLLAKKGGQTSIFLWEETGKRTVIVRVFEEDLFLLKDRIDALLRKSEIKGVSLEMSAYEGKLVATGELSKEKKAEFTKLVTPFAGNLRDLTKEVLSEDLVQIDVQIAELTASASKTLGLDWTSAVTYNESSLSDEIFKVSPLSRSTKISTIVNALVTEGKGRVLSKPKLVVVSGKQASFQVGGQIPVSTTSTSSGGTVQQNVEFKSYGITLTITPTIKDDKVDVELSVDVSDVDQGNAVGENVAFTTRNAQTQLFLGDGQTVVLAGLIKHNEGETVSKIPFLGDIPLIGLVFRLKKSPSNADTELVITLTPTIIKQNSSKEKVSTPDQQESTVAQSSMEDEPSRFKKEVVIPREEESSIQDVKESTESSKGKEGPTDIVRKYTQNVQQKISQAITYPFEAKEKEWEGIVNLNLRILKDGSLADVSVKESSGHSVFDKDAVNTAQILAPFDSFPEGLDLQELVVCAPIVYSQQAFLKSPKGSAKNTTSKMPSEPSSAEEVKFAESVQQRISGMVEYPDEAREYGWEGTVKLLLVILNDGTLASASIKESSGYEIFDKLATKIAKDVAPYPGFPSAPDLQELKVTVPIVFSLERE